MENLISDYNEACAKLGRDPKIPTDLLEWPEHLQKHVCALFKQDTLLEVNNGTWKANTADTNQKKWYPVFEVVKDSSKDSGFGLSFIYHDFGNDFSNLGARPACCSPEVATFMGENCAELYEELHR